MTFVNGSTTTGVVIDTNGVLPGEYNIVLESFNTLSIAKSTLKTETIKLTVLEALPIFSEDLPVQALTIGVAKVWELPSIESPTPLKEERIEPALLIEDQTSFNVDTQTFSFSGEMVDSFESV